LYDNEEVKNLPGDVIIMMSPKQYKESLRRLKLEVYMFGKRVSDMVDDPLIRPSMKAVAKTYELAQRPEHEPIMTAASHITGRKINRFTHIHQSTGDLVSESKMGRLLGRETGCCFQRCVGMDADAITRAGLSHCPEGK
jgi:4-hydroxybutyryl-CoA dehydratase/vinylacetyl-CoA-Delta-isomerase